ncbi:MAG: hypothetical protein WBW31_02080 [Candidatus Sulfotelmatobacter sp.]
MVCGPCQELDADVPARHTDMHAATPIWDGHKKAANFVGVVLYASPYKAAGPAMEPAK